MKNFMIFLGLWLPVIFWCGLLFYLSSVPNLRVVENNLWDEILRSGAHFGFYTILYFLFFRALNWQKEKKFFWLPLVLTAAYALSDEFHQSFVPTRTFTLQDLALDSSGGFLGLVLLSLNLK